MDKRQRAPLAVLLGRIRAEQIDESQSPQNGEDFASWSAGYLAAVDLIAGWVSELGAAALPDEQPAQGEVREAFDGLIETADYVIDSYMRLWKGGVVRDLQEAEGAYAAARDLLSSRLLAPPAGPAVEDLVVACRRVAALDLFVPEERLGDGDLVMLSVGTFRAVKAAINSYERATHAQ